MKKRSVLLIVIGPKGTAHVVASRMLRQLRDTDGLWLPASKIEVRSATAKLMVSLVTHKAFTIVPTSSSEPLEYSLE